MSEELSVELVDEATLALTSVVRLTLPADRWDAVGESVRLMDDAVWAGDGHVVRGQLRNLRSAVIGTAPRPRPGEGAAPTVNPLSYRTTDYVTRTPVRTISIVLIGACVLLATLLVLVMVVLAAEPPRDAGPAAAPTTVSVPVDPQPPEGGSGGVYMLAVGAMVLAGIGGFTVMIWRRRTGAARTPATEHEAAALPRGQREPPPPDVVDAVDRVVAALSARREGS